VLSQLNHGHTSGFWELLFLPAGKRHTSSPTSSTSSTRSTLGSAPFGTWQIAEILCLLVMILGKVYCDNFYGPNKKGKTRRIRGSNGRVVAALGSSRGGLEISCYLPCKIAVVKHSILSYAPYTEVSLLFHWAHRTCTQTFSTYNTVHTLLYTSLESQREATVSPADLHI